MLKRFFVFLMAFSLLSANLAQAMSSDEENDDSAKSLSSKPSPPSARNDSLDPQDVAFISITFASLIAAFYFVLKSKPN